MVRMYKYHVRLYRLYEVFGDKIFYCRQAEEALKSSSYIEPNTLYLAGLQKRKFVRMATRKEVMKELDKYDFRRHYKRLSLTGLEVARNIENNKRYLTMFMLRN